MATRETDFTQRTRQLEERIVDPHSIITIDSLLDSINALIYDSECVKRTKNFDTFYAKFQSTSRDIRDQRINFNDFEPIKIIGKGAFGTVKLVRLKSSTQVYAMKTLNKYEMIKRSDTAFFWEERSIMAFSNSDWIVKLHYAFQDVKNLYMIMDYIPGGDLITLLERFEIPDTIARFYCAEVVLAIDAIHTMGYIHRDIKPDNILLDANGHLKLADFGTCVKMDKDGLVRSVTAAGTPDYVSPEILLQLQSTIASYGREVDWWSVGIVLYEMLFSVTPFSADSLPGTYHNIMHYRENLSFPKDTTITSEAESIIRAFLTDRTTRLGKNGAEDIKAHPYFTNHNEWTWETIRQVSAPIIPTITNPEDTSNFSEVENQVAPVEESFSTSRAFVGNQLSFIGFSFSNEQQPFIERRSTSNNNNSNNAEFEQRLQENERIKIELENQIRRSNDNFNAKCQEQQILNSKLYELERENIVLTTQSQEAQRKYELELENRRTYERKSEELQDLLEATNRQWTEKITNLERQLTELNHQLQMESDNNFRLKRQNQELERNYKNLEDDFLESEEKYQELNDMNLTIQRNFRSQQSMIEQETNAKLQALEKVKQLEEKYNTMMTENSEIKHREVLQTDELAQLRQSSSLLEREKLSRQAEIDSLRVKLTEEETAREKLQEQIVVEQLKSVTDDDDINHRSEEIIKDLEKKLDAERLALRKSNDKLIESQQEVRTFEINYRELTTNYNQLNQDYQLFKESNAKLVEKIEQYDKEIQQLQQQIQSSVQKEIQMHEQINQLKNENENLTGGLHHINDEYEIIKRKIVDYEEQIQVKNKSLEEYRAQINELKDETNELNEKLRSAYSEQKKIEDKRDNLSKQLKIINDKLKTDNLDLKLLQEQCAKLVEENKIMNIKLNATQKDWNIKLNLLDSELNTLRDQYENSQRDLRQAIAYRETMTTKYNQANNDLKTMTRKYNEADKDLETMRINYNQVIGQLDVYKAQVNELSKTIDDEPAKSAVRNPPPSIDVNSIIGQIHNMKPIDHYVPDSTKRNPPDSRLQIGTRRPVPGRTEHNVARRAEQELQKERERYTKLQYEKDREITALNDEINKLKRDLDTKRADIDRLKRKQLDFHHSTDSVSTIISKSDDNTNDQLQTWVQIPSDDKGRKQAWKRLFAVLTNSKFLLYNSKNDPNPFISIDLNQLMHVRAVNQPDVLHVRPEMLPKIFQIMYDTQDQRSLTLSSSSLVQAHDQDRHTSGIIEYRGHSFCVVISRTGKHCNICNHSTIPFLSSRAFLQCSHCGIYCHKQHYDDKDAIPPCKVSYLSVKPAKALLVMCDNEYEQRQWIATLTQKIPRQQTHHHDLTSSNS